MRPEGQPGVRVSSGPDGGDSEILSALEQAGATGHEIRPAPQRPADYHPGPREAIERASALLAASSRSSSRKEAAAFACHHLWLTGFSQSELHSHADSSLSQQRAGGGWSQNPHLDSDANATRLALHSLWETGMLKVTDMPYKHGVANLLSTQYPDGSWYVRSRAPKLQPYFQSGFPYDHDQWISRRLQQLTR